MVEPVDDVVAVWILELREPLLQLRATRHAPNVTEQADARKPRPAATTVGQRPHNPRYHYKGNATRTGPTCCAGSHEFKFGFDLRRQLVRPPVSRFAGWTRQRAGPAGYSSAFWNYRLSTVERVRRPMQRRRQIAPDQRRCQIEVWNNPAYAKVVTHYADTFVTDPGR